MKLGPDAEVGFWASAFAGTDAANALGRQCHGRGWVLSLEGQAVSASSKEAASIQMAGMFMSCTQWLVRRAPSIGEQ